ncbi:BofC C-terminal domain-containing protein [Paenibacillus sp. IB182496]|uniref:BofC C-terminal domain-containing protein n=1 Tax=Paenibacillus sabuli TaxID=2772509 RepID=A0A927BS91_9BACL|nr:BofC C-terminal domain-containing protein [Paenibacillus sabuli]MBD2844594.1 BofC C-terminal domain-containing protein [Paenibacillus sabuli]
MKRSLWKQLKKQLRRRRRPLLAQLALALTVITAVPSAATAWHVAETLPPESSSASGGLQQQLAQTEGLLEVRLQRTYLCGEETSELGSMTGAQALALLVRHPSWTASVEPGRLLVSERIDDLSEACSHGAFFGVDRSGNLSLYDGPPREERLMRTFYQLDVGLLESRLPAAHLKRLHRGIEVTDVVEYNSVLSMFSEYALRRHDSAV